MENGLILNNIWYTRLVHSLIVIVLALFAYKFITYLLNRSENKSSIKLFASNKGKTFIKLMNSIIKSIILILTILMILKINGVDVSSILAGVGIFGVVFGLAIQDWLKDIIRGSSILSDDYFEVGNIVKYKNIEGKVLVIGLKTTKIKDLATGNIISIANRNIDEAELVSNFIYLRIPMPYEVKLDKAEKAIEDIIKLVKENDKVKSCEYKGVAELADSKIEYLLGVECNPEFKLQTKRDTIRCILESLENNKIEVPYTQIDIHNK